MKIGDKYFLNLQEAVAWLLANNALPFQCNVNYIANTEIAKTAIINPSPAEIKVGALVLFADSKIGTISGLTTNGFMVGSDYTDVANALAYITSVDVNGSGYLTVTLSDGRTINAGLIKQISSFSIDGSQHLIANFNDGTTNDLGAIFNGNINISGDLTVSGTVDGDTLTGNLLLEKMSGYSLTVNATPNLVLTKIYAGVVKTGNKITFAFFGTLKRTGTVGGGVVLANIYVPDEIGDKLFPFSLEGLNNVLDNKIVNAFDTLTTFASIPTTIFKQNSGWSQLYVSNLDSLLTLNTDYVFRYEVTFLLSDSL